MGGIGGTGVIPESCQPGSSLCRDGSKPCGSTYGLATVQQHNNAPRQARELCTHAHEPACNIRSSPDCQLRLRGHYQQHHHHYDG